MANGESRMANKSRSGVPSFAIRHSPLLPLHHDLSPLRVQRPSAAAQGVARALARQRPDTITQDEPEATRVGERGEALARDGVGEAAGAAEGDRPRARIERRGEVAEDVEAEARRAAVAECG